MFRVRVLTIVLMFGMIGAAAVTGYGHQAGKATQLTPEEQERFEAGREVYKNICHACHQPDGRGREKLAPSLVGSSFALGPAEIAIRIVLQGKQGDVGLMPPMGATLSDEQIAGVLTYIRREWGRPAHLSIRPR